MMNESLERNVVEINSSLFTATLLTGASACSATIAGDGYQLLAAGLATAAASQIVAGARRITKDYAMRKKMHDMVSKGSGAHSARWASEEEMDAAGMFDGVGRPLGMTDGGRVFFEPHRLRPVHSKIMATNGAGKTVGAIVPAIMHLALSPERRALIVPDLKTELAAQCAEALMREGVEVWIVDDSRATPYPATGLNILQPVVTAAGEGSPDAASLARNFALMLEPEPPGDGKNKYFRDGPRDCIRVATEYLARVAPEECIPSAVQAVLGDSKMFAEVLQKAKELGGGLGTAAGRLLDKREEHPEHFSDFRTTALQKLEIYEEGGRLYAAGDGAVRRYDEVRERQVVVFLVSSLQHMKDLKVHTMLHVSNFLHVCKRFGHPVTVIIDEFTNLPIQNIVEDLTIVRGFGCRVVLAAQAESEVERQFSPQLARTIDTLVSIKQIMAVTRFEDAKAVSEATGRGPFAVAGLQEGSEKLVESLSDAGRPLLTPDEVLSLPSHRQIIFCDGMRPILADKIRQNEIAPMCHQLADNPLEKGRLTPDPVVEITYGDGARGSANVVKQLKPVVVRSHAPAAPSYLRWAYFQFVAWFGILGAFGLALSGAHLRASYEYRQIGGETIYESCTYLGARQHFTHVPSDGTCPLIKWSWNLTG